MKATIERATLLKCLGHVQSVVERRNTIPILSNVLIEAREDGSLRLMATDLDLQVDETVQANVSQAQANVTGSERPKRLYCCPHCDFAVPESTTCNHASTACRNCHGTADDTRFMDVTGSITSIRAN